MIHAGGLFLRYKPTADSVPLIVDVSRDGWSCKAVRILWAPGAWQDYLYWSRNDLRVHAKINPLIEDIQRHPFTGLVKPEPLKRNLSGFWSRRITREHRLVYRIERRVLQIAQCRFHY